MMEPELADRWLECIRLAVNREEELIASLERDLRECQQKAVELNRKMRIHTRQAEWLRRQFELDRRKIQEQFERLSRWPGVARVHCEQDAVIVDTEPIIIEFEGKRFRVGTYQVRIGAMGDIKITNQCPLPLKAYWDHPHVQHGIPCLGGMEPSVSAWLAEGELEAVIGFLLDFLHTYHPESAYGPIDLWEELSD